MLERLERLINLVIALRETRVPLSAQQIREQVAGYAQTDWEAFRRMFERDKADLRALGVPLETAPVDAWGDRHGYRIDPEAYDLPELELEPDELAALALAVDAAGLRNEAAPGLRKIAVAAQAHPPARVPWLAIGEPSRHLEELATAQTTRTAVRFAYRSADGQRALRTLDPHALVCRRGRWYVLGRDHERDARRAFRLDRIEGPVQPHGPPGAFTAPGAPPSVEDVLPRPEGSGLAEVVCDASCAWQLSRDARGGGRSEPDGRVAFSIPIGDEERFVSWALEHAPEVEVRAPETLRARVLECLRGLAQAPVGR